MKKYDLGKEEIIWRDRRRILGMPITFTRYEATQERLTIRRGLFTTRTDEVQLYRILDFSLTRSFGQKIFGVGTVKLYSGDKSNEEIHLINIRNSDMVRRLLGQLVEEERDRKRVSAREMYGQSFGNDPDGLDGDGRPDYLE